MGNFKNHNLQSASLPKGLAIRPLAENDCHSKDQHGKTLKNQIIKA